MINILTLNWNGLDKLNRLALSLDKALDNVDHEVNWYIRDNGSSDGSLEWLKEDHKFRNYKIIPHFISHNRDNFAQGVNYLYEASLDNKSDYIMLLNNDIEFTDSNSIPEMLKLFKHKNIGVVGARLLYNGTDRLQHAGVIFGKRYGNMPYHFRHKEVSDSDAEKNRFFQAVTAACCLIRSEAMLKLEPKFNWAFEDIDLMLRINNKWKIAYCGKTKIFHEESASLKKNPVNKLFMTSNVSLFKKKWFGKYNLDHEKYLSNKNFNLIK